MTSTDVMGTIDLHIHSNASDGKFTPEQIFIEAKSRNIKFISITDHDSIASQAAAVKISKQYDIGYMVGIELNVTFSHPDYRNGKEIYLDFLGYHFNFEDTTLVNKLEQLRAYREERARKIINNLNVEFKAEGRRLFTDDDLQAIKETVDGAFGRPHIADYLVKQGIVPDRQAAFDTYLVKCYEPKFPLKLSDASKLIHDTGGKLALAHANDPSGTSLVKYTTDLNEQAKIIEESFLDYIDGIECWHSRHDEQTTKFYLEFAKKHKLIMTGGTDCHQKPVRMGSVQIPAFVCNQFQ
jgi:predicted metal-dependent phosphoesterase TrpH